MLLSVTMRIPSTLIGVQVSKAYANRMEEVESERLYRAVEAEYKKKNLSKGDKKEVTEDVTQKDENTKASSLQGGLSLKKIVDDSSSMERHLFRRLLDVLFLDQEWYQKNLGENPDLIDEILDFVEKNWNEKKPSKLKSLAEIDFQDETMQRFMRRILDNGLLDKNKSSLFLDVKKEGPLSVYLAKKPLLLALFEDQAVVDQIQKDRQRLYQEVTNRGNESLDSAKKTASAEFERLFSHYLTDTTKIDFRVSTSRPPK